MERSHHLRRIDVERKEKGGRCFVWEMRNVLSDALLRFCVLQYHSRYDCPLRPSPTSLRSLRILRAEKKASPLALRKPVNSQPHITSPSYSVRICSF